ncbi:MAG: ribulose-phosphate 3-epimerase [bacterium]
MKIVPTILVDNYDQLEKQLKQVERLFDYIQLDIMDGDFVPNKSFNHAEENTDLNQYLNQYLNYELHLMVNHPLNELKQWKSIKNVFRVVFHIESQDDPIQVIKQIKQNNWQAGIALNPDTPIAILEPYLGQIDQVLFMTVYPGRQGSPFLPEMKSKIIEFAKIPNHPVIAVDGGINQNTIAEVKSWGVEIFNVGSALMGADNIKEAVKKLISS